MKQRIRYFCLTLLVMVAGMASAEDVVENPVAQIGSKGYATLQEAFNDADDGDQIDVIKAGVYTLPNLSKNVTIEGKADGVVSFTHTSDGNIASILNGATFKNVTFNFGNVNYHGFQHAGTINMEGCTLNGKLFSYGDMNFTNCEFNQSNSDYHMWAYSGNLTYTGCTFTNTATGKFLNVYNEDGSTKYTVTVNNCKFVNEVPSAEKAALNVKATCGAKPLYYDVFVNNCTTEGAFPAASTSDKKIVYNSLIQVDDRASTVEDKLKVTQDGTVLYSKGESAIIEISTVEELKAFRDAVNNQTSYAGKTVKLTADLDLSTEENWEPIGDVAAYPGKAFKGTFDGGNHTISHLTIDDQTFYWGRAALFGSVSNATIKNLIISDVDIRSHHYAGAIVAYKGDDTNVTISNCHVKNGSIISTPELLSEGSYDNGDKVGAIVGYGASPTKIDGCSAENINIGGYRDLGSIAGYISGTVTNCSAKDVTITQDDTNGYKNGDMFATTVGKVVGGRSANAAAVNEANTTENVVLKHVGIVAKIGNKNFTSLEAAFAAAQDGETITLLADCTGNGIKAPQGKFTQGLTVDFAGHTYTVDGATVGSAGTETNGFQLLKDNKITFKGGTITSEKAKILVQNYSDLTLEGMTLTLNNANYASAYTLSNNNGNIVINGSTINANPAGGFAFDVCRYASYPSVNVTVKGESVINGDAEVSASGSDAKDGFKLMLEAGTLNGNIVLDASAKAAMAATPEKAQVMKSETFTTDAPADYKWVAAEEGTLKLVPCEYVAQVGDNKFETLEAAFAAAQDGETITLLADCTGNGIKAPQGKFTQGLTVDFAGHTYTVDGATVGSAGTETNGFQLLKDNKITFKGGTITSEKAKILVQNYSDLTLEGMTLTLNNANYTSAYTLSNNNGNIVIDGTTINANPAGGFAFDVCRYASYPSVGVTVKDNSKINGDVEVSASNNDAKDGFSLMLEGGTMTGAIVLDASAKTAMAATPEKALVKKSDTFSKDAPAGYKWVSSEGVSTLTPCDYVAQVGETKYETLADAFAAAADGNTVTLLKDVALTDRLFVNAGAAPAYAGSNNRYATTSENKSITLDLSGYNVTSGSNIALAGGSLNIVNNGTADAEHGVISTTNDGLAPIEIRGTGDLTQKRTMTVGTGVTLSGAVYGLNIFGSNDEQKNVIDVNVNGTVNGTLFVLGNLKNAENEININVAGTVYVPDNGDDEASVGVALNGIATVNVNEGAQVSGETGIEVRAGNLVVNGGNITATASTYSEKKNGSGSCTEGAAVAVAQHTTKLPITATLNGGTLTGTKTLVVTDVEEIGLNDVTVKAADALANAETVIIPAAYKWVSDGTMSTLTPRDPVAKIDETVYYSLADAVAAVPTDGTEKTITLLADVTENVAVSGGKNIVLDLGEKTLTGYIDLYDSELNVKNGNVAGTVYVNGGPASAEAGYNKFTLAVDATITSDWGFILYQGPNGNDAYGSVIDINGTVNGTAWVMGNIKEGNSVINVNKGAKIEGSVFGLNGLATLNVKEGATIIGSETGIEVRAGNLNVEGGTITSTATEYSVNPNGSGTTTTGAAIAIAQHTTGLQINANITGGTLNGLKTISVADPEGLNYTDVVVTAKDELTEKENNVIPDGYIWMSNNDGTSTLTKIEDGEYKLIDRVDYPFMNLKSDISVPEVTYQRSFSKTQVDKHQAWYVPMDYTITAEDAKNFTFYKLHMVAGAAEAGEADPNQIYLYVTPMNVGEKLVGNRPYTVKPKAAKENYKFTAENTILYAPNNGSRLNVTTSTHSYDFFGQYENTNYSGNKGDMYYLSQGALHPNNPTTPLLPYRWNIKVSSNSTNDGYAKIGFIIIEDEEATSINTVRDFNADEVEGIYSINGKKLNTPVKGINIIKYKNGKTEKRLIK